MSQRTAAFGFACLLAVVQAGVFVAVASPAYSQPGSEVPEDEVKAALILGFVRYSDWPRGASVSQSIDSITVCVYGRAALTRSVNKAFAGKNIGGRSVTARDVNSSVEAAQCSLLYLASGNRKQLAEVFSSIKDAAVLTIGESDSSANLGGIVQLFEEDGKIRFAVNQAALSRSRITISAKLLRLGQLIHPGAK